MPEKISKAEDYFRIVKGIAMGGQFFRNYMDVKMNPDCIGFYFKDKKETINVWEDVRALINKEFRGNVDGVLPTRMLSIVSDRLNWLKGTWTSPFTNEEKSKYILNIKNYPLFFSKKTIDTALKSVNIKDFITLKEAYGSQEDYYTSEGYFKVGTCTREKRIDTRGRRETITERGTKFFIPNSFQNKEGEFLGNCLRIEYPYLQKYDVKSYKLDLPYECYIKVVEDGEVKGSLYIPYGCFKNKTIKPAIERMDSYFRDYFARNPEEMQKHLNLMESSTFKALKKDIEG